MGKSKKTKKESKINKKIIFIIAAVVVLIGIGVGITGAVKSVAAKRLDVVFYNCTEEAVEAISAEISGVYDGKISFKQLEKDSYNKSQIIDKCDLFIAENGVAVKELEPFAKNIPLSVESLISSNWTEKSKKILPLYVDHWELDYYQKGMERQKLNFAWSLDELESVLGSLKEDVFFPFYCSGSENDTLLAFISVLLESEGGEAVYSDFCSKLLEVKSLEEIIDVEFTAANKKTITLRNILNRIIEWQDMELIYPKWLSAKNGDLSTLAGQRQIGIFFTSLSRHRKLSYEVVSGYSTERFPVDDMNLAHGLIAPSIVCLNLNKSKRFDGVVEALVQEKFQSELSAKTKLAPVNLRCISFDRQADDVRFMAAACPAGALSPLYSAAFQDDSSKKAKFADQIRIYLKSGRLNSDN